jgi:hypothetical protein
LQLVDIFLVKPSEPVAAVSAAVWLQSICRPHKTASDSWLLVESDFQRSNGTLRMQWALLMGIRLALEHHTDDNYCGRQKWKDWLQFVHKYAVLV